MRPDQGETNRPTRLRLPLRQCDVEAEVAQLASKAGDDAVLLAPVEMVGAELHVGHVRDAHRGEEAGDRPPLHVYGWDVRALL